jgi:hypothetical protein
MFRPAILAARIAASLRGAFMTLPLLSCAGAYHKIERSGRARRPRSSSRRR